MNVRLVDIAEVIRSKNSGPYELTFDVIFKDWDIFEKVCKSRAFNSEFFCKLYGITPEKIIKITEFKPAKAIKVTIARPFPSGNPGETDVYGAQQHAPLLGAELEI